MKKKARITHYIVTKRGLPCALTAVLQTQRAGILLPAQSEIQVFKRRRSAKAALKRTEKCRAHLRGSLVRDWLIEKHPQVRELLTDGEFAVIPIKETK